MVERRGRGPEDLAAELDAAPLGMAAILGAADDRAWAEPVPGLPTTVAPTLGEGVLVLWYDAYVHADDIRDAVGMPSVRSDGLRASLDHVRQLLVADGFGPARVELEGYGVLQFGDDPPGRSSAIRSSSSWPPPAAWNRRLSASDPT